MAAESSFRLHWRAFFSGGILSLTRLCTGFVRGKYVALVLGTAGVGFWSQASDLQILGISIASLSMAVGVINRMGAIGPDNPGRERRLLSTAFTAQTTVSIALLAGAVVFAAPMSRALSGLSLGSRLWNRVYPAARWFRPRPGNRREMHALLREVIRDKSPYVEFMLHSSELMPGGSPTFRDEASIDRLYEDLESILEEARALGCVGMTLKGYADQLDAASTSASRTLSRSSR